MARFLHQGLPIPGSFPVENLDQAAAGGYFLRLCGCAGRIALQAHRKANRLRPRYRHLIGPVRIVSIGEAEITRAPNTRGIALGRFDQYGITDCLSVGEYRDRIVTREGVARYKEKT